jgi:hypothetical protein
VLHWGEDGKKWFESLKSVYQNFSHALDAAKKRLELKSSERKVVLWQVAVAVVFRKNFR